jgi:hypothetical protein
VRIEWKRTRKNLGKRRLYILLNYRCKKGNSFRQS